MKECGGAVITDTNLDAALGRADTSIRAVRTPQQIAAIRWTNQFYQGNKLEYTLWGRTGGLIQMPNISYLTGAALALVGHLDRIAKLGPIFDVVSSVDEAR